MADFASAEDVATRLRRELTTEEQAAVELEITLVSGLIRGSLSKAADWDPDPVPAYFRALAIAKAIASISNPANLAAQTLGEHSVTFPRSQDGSPFLTPLEEHNLDQVLHGAQPIQGRTKSVLDDLIDYAEGREPGTDPE